MGKLLLERHTNVSYEPKPMTERTVPQDAATDKQQFKNQESKRNICR